MTDPKNGFTWDETYEVANAKKLFPGHDQPRKYTIDNGKSFTWQDTNPKSLDKQVTMAKSYGIDTFLFASYIGEKDGQIIEEKALPRESFLSICQKNDLGYGMVAILASPRRKIPFSRLEKNRKKNREYSISMETARAIVDKASKFWGESNYFNIKERPYLALMGRQHQVKSKPFKEFVQEVRNYSKSQYSVKPYLVGIVYSNDYVEDMVNSGVDAISSYGLLADFENSTIKPIQDYSERVSSIQNEWKLFSAKAQDRPFIPPVVVGWDASPRGLNVFSWEEVVHHGSYPHVPICINSNQKAFKKFIKQAHAFIKTNVPEEDQYLVFTAWNELGEGCALIPRLGAQGEVDNSYLNTIKGFLKERNYFN